MLRRNFYSFLSINKLCCLVENAKNAKIIAYKNGNISAIWAKNDGTNDIIQSSYSSDFGQTWSTPINLSVSGENAAEPRFSNDNKISNLYAIWKRFDGFNDIIQFSSSKDFGINWITPNNLSDLGQNAFTSHITTGIFNNKIYALWARSNSANDWARPSATNDIIQFIKSVDGGITWSTIEALSLVGQGASNPQISIDQLHFNLSTIWKRSNGVNDIIQFRFSKDWGNTWNDEVDLSHANRNSKDPKVISIYNSIYAIWTQTDGSYDVIHFKGSRDRSSTWLNSIALSNDRQTAKDPQFIAPNGGQFIYAIWARNSLILEKSTH